MWDSVLGHQKVKLFLEKCLQAELKPHALLFTGQEGLGKKKLALLFARSVLCKNNAEHDSCESCRLLNFEQGEHSHPDFIFVEPEEGSKNIKIEQIKELIRQAAFAPVLGRSKLCIIDGADKMTVEAANSFLKLLEEPPAGWIIILVAAAETRLLPTILSRVIKVNFNPVAAADVQQLLINNKIEASEAEVLAHISEGSVGLALNLYQQKIFDYREQVYAVLEALPLEMPGNYLAGRVWLDKYTMEEAVLFVKLLQLMLRDMFFVKMGLTESLYNTDLLSELQTLSSGWDMKRLKQALKDTEDAYQSLMGNTSKKMVLEALIIKIDRLRKE